MSEKVAEVRRVDILCGETSRIQEYNRTQGGAKNAQETADEEHSLTSWRDGFKEYSRSAMKVAAERGGFASLR